MNHLDTWTELILAVHVKKNISLLCQAGLFIPLFEGCVFFLLLVCVHLIFIFNPAAAVLLASGKY